MQNRTTPFGMEQSRIGVTCQSPSLYEMYEAVEEHLNTQGCTAKDFSKLCRFSTLFVRKLGRSSLACGSLVGRLQEIHRFLSIILSISSVPGIKDQLVEHLAPAVFETITDPDVDTWCGREILKTFNECVPKSNREMRSRVMSTHENRTLACKLFDLLVTCGDYYYQTAVVECLFRMCSEEQLKKYITDFIPEDEQLRASFLAITVDGFNYEVRMFLNLVNEKMGNIFSVMCREVIIDDFSLPKPTEFENGLWVDFSVKLKMISWYVEHTEGWQLFALPVESIKTETLEKSGVMKVSLTISGEIITEPPKLKHLSKLEFIIEDHEKAKYLYDQIVNIKLQENVQSSPRLQQCSKEKVHTAYFEQKKRTLSSIAKESDLTLNTSLDSSSVELVPDDKEVEPLGQFRLESGSTELPRSASTVTISSGESNYSMWLNGDEPNKRMDKFQSHQCKPMKITYSEPSSSEMSFGLKNKSNKDNNPSKRRLTGETIDVQGLIYPQLDMYFSQSSVEDEMVNLNSSTSSEVKHGIQNRFNQSPHQSPFYVATVVDALRENTELSTYQTQSSYCTPDVDDEATKMDDKLTNEVDGFHDEAHDPILSVENDMKMVNSLILASQMLPSMNKNVSELQENQIDFTESDEYHTARLEQGESNPSDAAELSKTSNAPEKSAGACEQTGLSELPADEHVTNQDSEKITKHAAELEIQSTPNFLVQENNNQTGSLENTDSTYCPELSLKDNLVQQSPLTCEDFSEREKNVCSGSEMIQQTVKTVLAVEETEKMVEICDDVAEDKSVSDVTAKDRNVNTQKEQIWEEEEAVRDDGTPAEVGQGQPSVISEKADHIAEHDLFIENRTSIHFEVPKAVDGAFHPEDSCVIRTECVVNTQETQPHTIDKCVPVEIFEGTPRITTESVIESLQDFEPMDTCDNNLSNNLCGPNVLDMSVDESETQQSLIKNLASDKPVLEESSKQTDNEYPLSKKDDKTPTENEPKTVAEKASPSQFNTETTTSAGCHTTTERELPAMLDENETGYIEEQSLSKVKEEILSSKRKLVVLLQRCTQSDLQKRDATGKSEKTREHVPITTDKRQVELRICEDIWKNEHTAVSKEGIVDCSEAVIFETDSLSPVIEMARDKLQHYRERKRQAKEVISSGGIENLPEDKEKKFTQLSSQRNATVKDVSALSCTEEVTEIEKADRTDLNVTKTTSGKKRKFFDPSDLIHLETITELDEMVKSTTVQENTHLNDEIVKHTVAEKRKNDPRRNKQKKTKPFNNETRRKYGPEKTKTIKEHTNKTFDSLFKNLNVSKSSKLVHRTLDFDAICASIKRRCEELKELRSHKKRSFTKVKALKMYTRAKRNKEKTILSITEYPLTEKFDEDVINDLELEPLGGEQGKQIQVLSNVLIQPEIEPLVKPSVEEEFLPEEVPDPLAVDKTLEDPVVLDLMPPSFPEFNRSMLASMNVSQGTEVSKVSPSNNSYVWNWIQCGCEKEAESALKGAYSTIINAAQSALERVSGPIPEHLIPYYQVLNQVESLQLRPS